MNIGQRMNLDGQVAVITGGSRGIGLQMAEALGEAGARVVLTARKANELQAAQSRLERMGIACLTFQNDLADFGSIPQLVDDIVGAAGRIDILINNAGCSWGSATVDHPDDAWHKVINLDLSAQFFISREVGRKCMIPAQRGKLINIASIAGMGGNPPQWGMFTIAYNSAKGGLINFTRALAAEWGQYNIQVNAICPGFFRTKLSSGLLDKIEEQYVDMTPARRLGDDEDLKGLVLLLASPASDYISGQAIAVDGGFSCV